MSGTEQLVRMANDIAEFFVAEPDHDAAVAGVQNHLLKFWEPRMRRKLIEHWRAGGTGLSPLAARAVAAIADPATTA